MTGDIERFNAIEGCYCGRVVIACKLKECGGMGRELIQLRGARGELRNRQQHLGRRIVQRSSATNQLDTETSWLVA
jgi:hypothetical protein